MSKKYICPNCNNLIIYSNNEKIGECLICGFLIKKTKMKTLTIILTISIILLLAIITHLLFGGVFGL